MPIEISCTVKNASALQTRMSHAVARSRAPPMQPPWIAHDDREARLVEGAEAVDELPQRLLEGEPLARRRRRERREVAGEDVERHAGREVLAGRRDHHRPRRAFVAEPAHGVADGGKERRRHRVQALGAVQLQVGDAVLVREFEEFGAVDHGVGR
jgi:hypothetical protein